ncbi:hypothetical protein CONPUDRAFT_169230 [Coniophora puteana RWD-64-598 SS2]|uniref:Uncharacterized protein n=1 Tax=Coniophora puteana (strain RWD-64-598) TaxID=741705 RepID=A0A5M3MAK7_CONPW|nr:uncharacterized protein CONPUDRAFT_169230 [Coniophora puteana RWD-64-598 SS2]EIW76006.1 hypothetical protein CONPUDRAFT_169230 [Coniophora puteana RWD-64-598 SS2]
MTTPTSPTSLTSSQRSSPRQGSESPPFCVPAIDSKRHLPRQRTASPNPRICRMPPPPGYSPLLSAPTPIFGVSSGVIPPSRSRLKPLILVRKLDFGMVERSSIGRSPLRSSMKDNAPKPQPPRKLQALKGILPLITRAASAIQAQTRTSDTPSPKSPTIVWSPASRKVPISGRGRTRHGSPGGTPCPARDSPSERRLLGLGINSPSRSSPLAGRGSVSSPTTSSSQLCIDSANSAYTSSVIGENASYTPSEEATSVTQLNARAAASPEDILSLAGPIPSAATSLASLSSVPGDAQLDMNSQMAFAPSLDLRDPTTATVPHSLKLRIPDLAEGVTTDAQVALELAELRTQRKVSASASGGTPRTDGNGDLGVVEPGQVESHQGK